MNNRQLWIDFVRGIAVLLMIFYHQVFDLYSLGILEVELWKNPFWFYLPRLIVFLFLFCVGVALTIVHGPTILWKKFWRRLLPLIAYALFISLFTFIFYREQWIYFGTLHCIALSSLLALPLLSRPKLAFGICVGINLLFCLKIVPGETIPSVTSFGPSMDFEPIFPWFSVVALGIAFRHLMVKQGWVFSLPDIRLITFCGRHALLLYFLHRPVVFLVAMLLNFILR
ncbi:MAG: DUF1624 domain-containing protein [Oligoflexia bacterium]|nr:DUF1624 domain-containing protein [Oligoflexia bacterium]MBF0367385.1 DUF1624 domain-containing protein [Oligoflexia bacterium]